MPAEHPDGESPQDTGAETAPRSAGVERVLFQTRVGFVTPLYRIVETDEDRQLLQEWKTEIDADRALVTERCRNEHRKQPDLRNALGENPTSEDITLFCIGRFIRRKMRGGNRGKNWLLHSSAKLLLGGKHTLAEFGRSDVYTHCMDTAVITKVLAEMYHIQGDVVAPDPKAPLHLCWQRTDGTKAIIDLFFQHKTSGYLRDPALFHQTKNTKPERGKGFGG